MAERVIDELLKNARANYVIGEIKKDIDELSQALDSPCCINKGFALTICNALITICIEDAGVKEGSIMHLLGLLLMDYIKRTG